MSDHGVRDVVVRVRPGVDDLVVPLTVRDEAARVRLLEARDLLVGVGLLGVDDGAFWSQMQSKVELRDDIINGVVIKSFVFGLVVTWIAASVEPN